MYQNRYDARVCHFFFYLTVKGKQSRDTQHKGTNDYCFNYDRYKATRHLITTRLYCHSGASDRRDEQIYGSLPGLLQLRLRRLDRQASDPSKSKLLGSAKLAQRRALEEFEALTRGVRPGNRSQAGEAREIPLQDLYGRW